MREPGAWKRSKPKEQGSGLSPAVPGPSAPERTEWGQVRGGGQLRGWLADCCGADPSLCVYPCVGFQALKEPKSQVERTLDEFCSQNP